MSEVRPTMVAYSKTECGKCHKESIFVAKVLLTDGSVRECCETCLKELVKYDIDGLNK